MKIAGTFLIAFILCLFGPKVKLIDATSQDWIAGRYESGRGTDFVISLKARGGSDNIRVEKLWVDGYMYEVEAVKDLAKRSDKSFDRGDTLYVKAGKKLKPDKEGKMKQVSGKNIDPEKEYEGAALLAYTWKGKRKYLVIKEFNELEKIIYP